MQLRQIALRNVFRNARRSLLSLAAIAVAAMAISILFGFLAGMKHDLQHNLSTYYTGEVRIRQAEFSENEHLNPLHLNVSAAGPLVSRVADVPGVASVSPRIAFPGVVMEEGTQHRLRGMGVDFSLERRYQDFETTLAEGRLPEAGTSEALLSRGLASEMGLSVGDRFTVLATTQYRGSNAMTFTVTGIVDFPVASLNQNVFMAPLDRVQYFLRMEDAVTEILVKGDGSTGPVELAKRVRQVVPGAEAAAAKTAGGAEAGDEAAADTAAAAGELVVKPWTEIPSSYVFIAMATTAYDIIAGFFFILGSTVIVNTTIMVIYERMREIGTLQALGMSAKQLITLFFYEALFIAMVGAFLGVAVGTGITALLATVGIDFSSAMQGVDFEISNMLYPQVTFKSTVVVFCYAVIVAGLASFIPSIRAARVNAVEALRAV